MVFTAINFLLVGSVLLFVSIIVSKAGSKFGVPTLLLSLIVGMLFGSDGLGIQFSDVKNAQFLGMLSLSIILFSGGMDTKLSEVKPVVKQGIALSTIGVILMTFITGLFIYLLTKNGKFAFTGSMSLCLLLAATMSSTDSASVFSILRTQNIGLRKHLRPMLELESGSNDPMAYMLTIALIQICQSSDVSILGIAIRLVIQFVVGTALGYILGRVAVWIINKVNLQNASLYPIILLSIGLFTFSITELARGNGYLAAYIAGIVIGNRPIVKKRECAKFLDGLTWLCQIMMFVTLGLLVNPHELIDVAFIASLIAIFMIFVARPISVLVTLLPFKKPDYKARGFASWVGLRGAAPIIFATYPVVADITEANLIFNIVFFITILSLLIQGTTIPAMAKLFDMTRKVPKEGNDFGIELPEEIDSRLWDIKVSEEMLIHGNQLKDMNLPKGILVIMIKRDNDYIVPNGTLEILSGDTLLLIAQSDAKEDHILQQ